MGHFSHCVQYYGSSSPPLQKQNSLLLNCKQATIFRLTLEEMGHPQPLTHVHCDNSTAVLPLVSPITPTNDNDRDPWRCNSFRLQMQRNRENLTYNTTLGKKTSQTTRVSTTQVLTIKQSALGISTNPIQYVNSYELASLAL